MTVPPSKGFPLSKSQTRLLLKIDALLEVVCALKPAYDGADEKPELRRMIETLVGAAIWYLPQPRELWTGKISRAALNGLPGVKLSRDHDVPRKIAGARLLKVNLGELTFESLAQLYLRELGRFNFVTKAENRKLMPFQRAEVYQDSESAYGKAGIELVDISGNAELCAAVFSTRVTAPVGEV